MKKKRTKYNVGKTTDRTYDGIVFDSAVEMKYYKEILVPKLNKGELTICERQKTYVLQPRYTHEGKVVRAIEYKADFYTVDKDGRETVIDIKGYPDPTAKLKRKLFWYIFPNINYVWIGYSAIDGGWTRYDDIVVARKRRKQSKTILRRKKRNGSNQENN